MITGASASGTRTTIHTDPSRRSTRAIRSSPSGDANRSISTTTSLSLSTRALVAAGGRETLRR